VNSQFSTFSSQPSIELHIEELVLHGFPPSDRYAIGEEVESQLVKLLGEQGVPSSLLSESATDEIRGATFNTSHNAKARAIGRQIAQAVYQDWAAGFNSVQITKAEGSPGAFTNVEVEFTK
jgi:hypothetical protein